MTTVPSASNALPLALTMGDPAGIGLDIAASLWAERQSNGCPPFVLYANSAAFGERARALGLDIMTEVVDAPARAPSLFADRLPLIDVPLDQVVVPGETDSGNAGGILASIERATEAVVSGAASALVTNPIAKSTLYAAGFKHPGHTEFLGELAERHFPGQNWQAVMMLASDELRVVPLTVHIPLKDVPTAITPALIEDIAGITALALERDFGIAAPRIAFAGLNPHAGEDGTMGLEERDIIAPMIAKLKARGMNVTGPHPGDTLFHAAARATYDAVIAMYHDQALIPLKTLAFDNGVNVTLGLPFIRTSPDHGTAFGIAGTGQARPDSLLAALRLAETMSRQRSAYNVSADGA